MTVDRACLWFYLIHLLPAVPICLYAFRRDAIFWRVIAMLMVVYGALITFVILSVVAWVRERREARRFALARDVMES